VLSQNWDWTATVKKNLAMVSIEQPDKPTIYMVTEVKHDSLYQIHHG
jgi:isopenicillin-N N-acyltransferase-like protein